MQEKQYLNALTDFLQASPTPFHAVAQAKLLFQENNFVELHEGSSWRTLDTGKYFVSRNDTSLIAFCWNPENEKKINMAGAHTDSPCLKIKPSPIVDQHNCLQLGVEVYGGALLHPWFDRELTIAGQVCFLDKRDNLQKELIHFRNAVAIIPSLAIHLDREANKSGEINKQKHLVPLVGLSSDFAKGFQVRLIEQLHQEHPQACATEIVDFELFVCDAAPPCFTGFSGELITASRLDNLLSCYACVQGIIHADISHNSLIVLNDHEEVGSVSTSGAQGSFLHDVLSRLLNDEERKQRVLHNSFFISADNAHAVHPNFSNKHDPQHMPVLGGGIVIKFNANQRYATSATTAAQFRQLCSRSQVALQEFVMRSDMTCGSTIGPTTAASLGVDTVDVGIPTLAMHSIRETAACNDCWLLYRVLKTFFVSQKI